MSLEADNLNQACMAASLPWRVQVDGVVTSTSDLVRDAALRGEKPGLVRFAESQTNGRGRRDTRWHSTGGRDLIFSMLLSPPAPVELWPRITTLAALALCLAIEEELPLRACIKWPNDVYVADRKVAGLLAEALPGTRWPNLVLGIGLNVNSLDFPEAIADTATSLLKELRLSAQLQIDRQCLALRILRQIHLQLQRIDHDFSAAMAEVRERSWLLGRQIRATVDGREVYGRVLDLNQEGHLVLACNDGSTTTLTSAECVRQVV